jgi:type VI secretion system secreted protein Hcp
MNQTNHWAALRALLGVALLCCAGAAFAQINVFLKIDGLPGDSTDIRHRNEIVLTGYSQSFGDRNCSRVVATKQIDRASPGLISRAASNQRIPQAIITMSRATGGGAFDFFTATIDQVLVDKIEIAEQSDQLVERVVLVPRVVTIQYRPQDEKGQLGASVTTSIACN